jgi:GT2 family glycosyltransferase
MPKVSVILTSFNHAKYIREAIDSVLNQNFTDFELIILDDCSSDNSWDLINQYSDPRINAFRNEVNKGPVEGVNKAISAVALGEYIAIHHSDDVWELDKLEKQVAFLDAHLDIGAVFTNALTIAEDSSPLSDEKHFYSNIFDQPNRTRHEWLRFFFSRGNALCHPTVLIRKQCYVDCGSYRDMLAQLPDFDMWIRLCLKYEIHVLPERLIKFRVRDNEANASGNRPEVRIRGLYEYYKLLQNYRKLKNFDDMVKVFPSAEKYRRDEDSDMDSVLGMIALEERPFTFTQLFGQDLLFEAISDPKRAANIKRLFDFDYKSFIALTGQHDVFSREEIAERDRISAERDGQIANLNQTVAERDGQIANLNQTVAERDGQIAALYKSTSWRVTRPLRHVGRIWRKVGDVRAMLRRLLQHEPLLVLLKRALRVLRNEGLRGLKARVRQQHYLVTQAPVIDALDTFDGAKLVRPLPPAEVARPLEIDYSVSVPFSFAEIPNLKCGKVAAIIHLYYEDLASEFQSYLSNVPVDLDVYISTTDAFKAAAIECVFAGWNKGSVEVRVVPNRGRDIAPKLVSFSDVYGRYDYVLFMHGKRSDHANVLSPWRHFLLESLLGTPQVVTSVLYAFEQNPNLGMIAAQHFEPMRHWINWGGNFQTAQKLAAKMGFTLDERDPLDFPSGSMFWARTLALKPLLDIGLKTEDFDVESKKIDATLAHAIERIFFHACEHEGFNWIKIARPELYEHTPKIVNVPCRADLSTFFSRYIFRLLDPRGVKPRSVMPNLISKAAPELFNHIRSRALGMHINISPGTRVAIGLVTYNNSEDELTGSIAAAEISLKSAGLSTRGALFLIDNGASTKNQIPETNFITRLETRGNLGFGCGHNNLMRAAFEAGYEIYITINPDGLLHPGAVEALVQTVQAAHGKALVEALQFPVEHPKPYDTQTLDTPWVSGACVAISRQAFDDLGGFDEDFFMYCEDVDLSWRARAHGYALKTCPRALFLHAVTNREMTPATLQMIFESGITLARKWGSLEFEKWLKGELTARGKPIPCLFPMIVPEEWRHFADFSHQFSFAQPRW